MTTSMAQALDRFFVLLAALICIESSNLLISRAETSLPSVSLRSRLKPAVELFSQQNPLRTEHRNFFEVTKPIQKPHSKPCSVLLLKHSFANTISSPPFVTAYNPSLDECGFDWEKVILKWKATCRGTQFDRISAVWLSGVEIFRTCTAEPTRDGIEWHVQKDVTRFSSLFKHVQTLVVSLANLVDKTYTGIYHVTITLDFYGRKDQNGASKVSSHADIVLPVALASPLNGGYWFQLQGASDVRSVSVTLPSNVYKATLEICVSFHGDDEFWYANPPNDYIEANNLTGQPGNGPFREVVVLIDEFVAGVVWPFPVVYTGGINPLFWRPVAAIGAFDLPSYDFDITPYLGLFADGRAHNISLRVTNALYYWLLDANLHLWLDPSSANVTAHLLRYHAPDVHFRSVNSYTGLDGSLSTKASRSIYYEGYVFSSYGNITTSSFHTYKFQNLQIYSDNASTSLVDQNIDAKSRSLSEKGSVSVNLDEKATSYPFSLFSAVTNLPNGTIIINASISHALNKHIRASEKGSSSLQNHQAADGLIVMSPNQLTSAYAALTQNYSFKSKTECYYRALSARNYVILSDRVVDSCNIVKSMKAAWESIEEDDIHPAEDPPFL